MPLFKDKVFNGVSETIYKMYSNLIKEKTDAENGRLKLEAVIKAMNEGIILLDKNGGIIHMNGRLAEYIGIKLTPGRNVIKDCENADLILFFKKLADCGEGSKRLKYKDLLFEAYSKKIGGETLIVVAEVTDKPSYETLKTEQIGRAHV